MTTLHTRLVPLVVVAGQRNGTHRQLRAGRWVDRRATQRGHPGALR